MNTLMGVVNKLCLEACYKTTNTVKLKFWIFRKPESAVRSSGLKLPQYVHFQFNQKWTTLQYVKATAKKNVKTVEHWTVLVKGTHYFFHVQDLLYSRFFYWWHEHILLNHNNCFIWCFFMPVQACVTENYKQENPVTP